MRDSCLLPENASLLLAVSGGVDSTCLLHLLAALRQGFGIRLHVVHLDHKLRGTESAADADYVRDLADSLDIPLTVDMVDVRSYKNKNKVSLEEAAREVRYTFLAQTAVSIGADYIATGHTLDDQMETILMHIIRGTGIKGLVGLKPAAEWHLNGCSFNLIRPLLTVSRSETAAYCKKHRLIPRLDSTNLSLSPLRNRIRQQLVPLLKGYNSGIADALLRMAAIAADETEFLDTEAARLWQSVVQEKKNVLMLDRKSIDELHPALKRHLLRVAIEGLLGSLKDIEARHIEEIMTTLDKQAGKYINLPGGLVFYVDYERYLLGKESADLCPYPVIDGEYPLKVPGETQLVGWRVEAAITDKDYKEQGCDSFIAYFDLDKINGELKIRQRKLGDRFQPLGMKETKKVNQFMINEKIPNPWRPRIPIVATEQQILWLVGHRIDDRVKISAGTKRILELKFRRY
ncbi:tRNA lysidine(34) synthetase TilS [Chloroflexota bacterium]